MRHRIPVTLLATTIFLGGCAGSSNMSESSGARQLDPATLIGMRGSSMDTQLADSGFVSKGGYKTEDASVTTWWNASSRQCLSVTTRQGRVAEAETIVEGNCL